MKRISSNTQNDISILTRQLFDFIGSLPHTSIKDPISKVHHLQMINRIRERLDLIPILLPRSIPMPEVKPPKKEECNHDFDVLQVFARGQAILFCRHCAKVKRISIDEKSESQETEQEGE